MPIARFNLFEVVQEAGDTNFGAALAEIAEYDVKDRVVLLGERQAILLESIPPRPRVSAYLFTRVRMDGLPIKTGLDGHREDLILDEDEGLGEDVAIAYDPVLNVVAIQRNRHSLSPSNIAGYVSSFFDDMPISLRPIFSQGALERFGNQSVLRKVRCRFASTTDLSFLKGEEISEAQRGAFQQLLDAPYVDITFSVGHMHTGLSGWFGTLAQKFATAFHSGEDNILKLEVYGKADDDSETEYIDLLTEKLTFEDTIKMNGRSIDTKDLMRLAKKAISGNRKTLESRNA